MLFKKMLRTVLHYKVQFISMIIMIALGIGVFLGFNMEWYTIKVDTENYFSETNFCDYRIINESGFSKADYELINESEGITSSSRYLAINMNVANADNKQLALNVCENEDFLKLYQVQGEEYYGTSDYAYLSDNYASANNINIGDTVSLSYLGKTYDLEVKGLVKHSYYLVCTADENQLMPDYTTFGYVVISPKKFKDMVGMEFYSEIRVISDLSKNEIEELVSEKLNKKLVVLGHDEDVSYQAAKGEIEEGKTMGNILPVLFLAIALLTMITTMHRVTTNEKLQIGTLKALGFKDRQITLHYSLFGLFIGLVGTVFGVLIGYLLCAIIMNPKGMMGTYFDMPSWDKQISWVFILVIIAVNLVLLLVSYLSVRKVLKGNAADTLRPYVPKNVKNLAIEKTRLWNHLSFATRWNLRDVFRNKTRSLMTILGVFGCIVLMIAGLGMKDTLNEMLGTLNDDVLNYDTKISLVETVTNDEALELANKYNGDLSATISVKLDAEPLSLDVYDVNNDMLKIVDGKNNAISLKNNGAYICNRVSDLGYKIGDTLKLNEYGTDNTYEIEVVGIYRSLTSKSIVITKDYADNNDISYTYNNIYTKTKNNNIESNSLISSIQDKETLFNSYDKFTEIMDLMVILLIVVSMVLGVVVLYNLGIMSYVERYKELSTLKVVGYKDNRIGKILVSQNIWLTVVGIIIGIPSGYGTLLYLCSALGRDYELKTIVSCPSYLIGIFLTLGVSLIVSLLVARKNKKIDMVASLKGNE